MEVVRAGMCSAQISKGLGTSLKYSVLTVGTTLGPTPLCEAAYEELSDWLDWVGNDSGLYQSLGWDYSALVEAVEAITTALLFPHLT